MKRTRPAKEAVPKPSSFLSRGARNVFGIEARSVSKPFAASAKRPREPRRRASSKRAVGGLGGVAPGEGAPLALGGEPLGELEVALGAGRVDEEAEDGVGEVLRLLPPQLPGEERRGGVVAPRLGQEGVAERGGLLDGPFPLETLGPERLEAAPFAGRRLRLRGDEAREGDRVEAGLEGVERGAQGAAGDGPFLPLEERVEELQGAEAVALLEAEARGGEARRNVEEVTRRDVALEPHEGLVEAAETREGARREEVEAAVGVARGGEAVELPEVGEDVGPVLGAGRLGRVALEGAERLGRDGRRGGRSGSGRRSGPGRGRLRGGRRREREERGGGERRARDPAPHGRSPRDARDAGAERGELLLHRRIAPVEVVDAPHEGLSLGDEARRGRAPPRRAGRRR